jgi:lysyl-tRNA synthetase class II
MKTGRRGALLVLMAVAVQGLLQAQTDGAAVVEKSRNRISAVTVSTRSRMILTAKDGSTSQRVMDQYEKKNQNGDNRSVIVFQSPATVEKTRFLTIENQKKSNDQWIFIPSVGKVRRLEASEGSSKFMGSDFSNDDVASANRDVNLDTHRILREDRIDGKDCYVIESVPKDSKYQYSKMVQYIDKNNFINYLVELYDVRGTKIKTLEAGDIRDIQGRLTAMRTKMTTIAANTSTTLIADIKKYDDPIPESVFTPDYLATGRARS